MLVDCEFKLIVLCYALDWSSVGEGCLAQSLAEGQPEAISDRRDTQGEEGHLQHEPDCPGQANERQ